MRKLLAIAVLAALALGVAPAQAKTLYYKRTTFKTDISCGAACAHQLDYEWAREEANDFYGEDVEKSVETEARATTGEKVDVPAEQAPAFQACSAPFPSGAYADKVVKAPKGAKLLIFQGMPKGDWDIFICSKPRSGNNGRQLAMSANYVDECQLACVETAKAVVKPGRRYVLRAYNYADTEAMPAKIWFKS